MWGARLFTRPIEWNRLQSRVLERDREARRERIV